MSIFNRKSQGIKKQESNPFKGKQTNIPEEAQAADTLDKDVNCHKMLKKTEVGALSDIVYKNYLKMD